MSNNINLKDIWEYAIKGELDEKIVKKGSKWQVQSEKGRNMGTYDTKGEAEKRLGQVEYFKHLNETNSDNIKEEIKKDGKLHVYRVGDIATGRNYPMFFADKLEYYDYSETGYGKEGAEEYILTLDGFKVWNPIEELGLTPYSWSDIRGPIEVLEENGIYVEMDWDDEIDGDGKVYHEASTSTDSLAMAGKRKGYDIIILKDIPVDFGPYFTEYAVCTTKCLKEIDRESLNEGIADVKAHYPKVSDNDFNAIIKADPTFKDGQDRVGTYGKWLLNLYNKNNLKLEDLYKATEYLTEFERKKKLFKNKDIGQFKSLSDLYDALQQVGEVELNDNQKQKQFHKEIRKAQLNAKVVLDTDKWIVYIPNDYGASCKLSTNTEWCTGISSKGNDYYYNLYSKEGPLYIIHNKNDEDEKYQFHFESSQFMDRTDRRIDLVGFLNAEPELKGFFYPLALSTYYKDLGIDKDTDDDAVVSFIMNHDALESAMSDVKGDGDRFPSGDWVMSFLDDPYSAYDFYSEGVDIGDVLRYCDIDDKIFAQLKALGCSAENAKDFCDKASHANSLEYLFPENICDEVETAFCRAYDEGNYVGTINACENDIVKAFSRVFEPLETKLLYEEGLKITGTKKQWENLIMQIKSEYEDDYDYSTRVYEVLSRGLAEWFEVREPYYGWNDFDQQAFLDRLSDELYEIGYNKKESLKEWIEKFGKDNGLMAIEGSSELSTLLKSHPNNAYRIYFDDGYALGSKGMYFVCDATSDYTHYDMLDVARENSFYTEKGFSDMLDDFTEGCGDKFIIYIGKGFDKDVSYGSELGSDGYEEAAVYPFGTLLVRSHYAYKTIPLFNYLGKPDTVLAVDGFGEVFEKTNDIDF